MKPNDAACAKLLRWLADAYWNVPGPALLDGFDPALAEGLADGSELASAVGAARAERELRDLAVDYTGLFASTREAAPAPYESYFADGTATVMGEARDRVAERYAIEGYVPERGESNEPEDHLSSELRFAAFLLERSAEGGPDSDRLAAAARTFAREHLAPWLPAFRDRVALFADTGFYRAVAKVTCNLIEEGGPLWAKQ